MNAVKNLSRNNLKTLKGRNRLIVLTIILSTCLLTSIAVLSNSIQKTLLQEAVRYYGSYHGHYNNITENQLEVLKNNQMVEQVGESVKLGATLPSDKNERPYTMQYIDEIAAEMLNIEVVKGNLPKEKNEITLDERTIEKLGGRAEIGEKLSLRFTIQYETGNNVVQEERFIISGIVKLNGISSCPIIAAEAYVKNNPSFKNLTKSAYIRIKDKTKAELQIMDIGRKIGLEDKDIYANSQYIKASGGDIGVVTPFILIGLIVVFAGGIVIYNIFYISIVERIQQFGLLSALGATKKQIRMMIVREGMILSIIGIPGGIVLGHLLSFGIIPMFHLDGLVMKSSIYIVLVAALVSFSSVMLSLIKPGKYAARISPVEAIRYNGAEIKMRKKERRSTSSINIRRMAYLNLWRNKKRTLMTIVSLTMSGILFLVFSTLLGSMSIDNLVNNHIKNDFQLAITMQANYGGSNPLNEELMGRIKFLEGIKNLNWMKTREVEIQDDSQEGQGLIASLYAYDEEMLMSFNQYLSKGKISMEDMKNKNQVLLAYGGSYTVGDRLTLKVYDLQSKEAKSAEATVAGIIEEDNGRIGRGIGPTLIAHNNGFTEMTGEKRISNIFIDAEKGQYEKIDSALKEIINGNKDIVYISREGFRQKSLEQYRGLQAAAVSLVVIIGLIGMLNLINTMITSILSRKKELGMLQAVGMTGAQLRRMLQIEGLYFAVTSSVLSIGFGTALGYGAFIFLKKVAEDYAQYKFPLVPVLHVALIFIGLQALVTFLVEKNIKKDSIVERLRYIG